MAKYLPFWKGNDFSQYKAAFSEDKTWTKWNQKRECLFQQYARFFGGWQLDEKAFYVCRYGSKLDLDRHI